MIGHNDSRQRPDARFHGPISWSIQWRERRIAAVPRGVFGLGGDRWIGRFMRPGIAFDGVNQTGTDG